MTKTEIRHLIADGQLRPAVAAAIEYAEKCQLPDPLNALTVLSGNLETHQRQWSTNQISYEEFLRTHARSAAALTDWLDQLPDSPTPAAQTRMLDENQYKWRIFWFFVGVKVIVLGRLWYHWDRGGFTQAEFFSTLTLLGAALAAHAMVMFDDLLRPEHTARRRFVATRTARLVQGVVLLYGIGLFAAIEYKAMHNERFAEMNTIITLTETLLGGMVGKAVARFFKKTD